MSRDVIIHPDLRREIRGLPESVRVELVAAAKVLELSGPNLGRPLVDTLNASMFANMKELRFSANRGVWRLAFAFDPHRNAVLLVTADKRGVDERRFYKRLIKIADQRYAAYLNSLNNG